VNVSIVISKAVLDDGITDAVSMCPPFIINPYLVKDIREGSSESPQCTSFNH
jgi:2,4-dienoyl-CoA reductase-like NADH-dependent reductase (Old Yellow Enzyme family)